MKFTTENLDALDLLAERFRKLQNPNAELLMLSWMRIIEEDNRRGVLAGLDKDGIPLAPVTYRPVPPPLKPKASWKGFKGYAAELRGNLTGAEYRRLTGPPLAPRGRDSRVITNLQTDWNMIKPGSWTAYGYWREVVNIKGEKFLHYHFQGIGQKESAAYGFWRSVMRGFGEQLVGVGLKKRDLTGVRPEGLKKAREAARNWIIDAVRSGGV